jgi:dTDP-4-amino-4,6-dideoxygalactose transaminase
VRSVSREEIIVPSFTFIATGHALQWQEITPVFCDMDSKIHILDPAQVEKMIAPRTTGIIVVYTWGRACDIDALEEIAHRRNVQLAFDAAHAFGCSHKGRLIGRLERCEVLSTENVLARRYFFQGVTKWSPIGPTSPTRNWSYLKQSVPNYRDRCRTRSGR